jgi:hypothetical protein
MFFSPYKMISCMNIDEDLLYQCFHIQFTRQQIVNLRGTGRKIDPDSKKDGKGRHFNLKRPENFILIRTNMTQVIKKRVIQMYL